MPERFERIFGLSVHDFDALLERLNASLNTDKKQHQSDLAEEVSIALLAMRQSMTHEVLSASFGRAETAISEIIRRLEPHLNVAQQATSTKGSSLPNKRKPEQDLPEDIDEALKLLQELSVYQIELKAQNAELQVSRAEAEEQLRRYTELYEFAPMGYFTVSCDGSTIQQANLAAERLLGSERAKFLHQPFDTVHSRRVTFPDKRCFGEGLCWGYRR